MSHLMPNLDRTEKALAEYDEVDATYAEVGAVVPVEDADALLDKLAELGRKVGEAYALDTADRNPASVADLIRPGPAVPSPGCELSFVRRMVKCWQDWKAVGGS